MTSTVEISGCGCFWNIVITQNRIWCGHAHLCNGGGYHPTAHKWCLEKNLTTLGNSDIHGPDLKTENTTDDHRTMTLVFVKQRTLDSLKEALFAGRTVVWFKEQLIGRRELLEPLLEQCVEIAAPHLRSDRYVWVKVKNVSDLDIVLERTGNVGPRTATLPAGKTSLIRISTSKPNEPIELSYKVTNFLIGPDEGLPVTVRIPAP